MKAAVLEQLGSTPIYTDFSDPVAKNENELIMNVKAAAVKNLDKLRASGTHYASYKEVPVIVGIDAAGVLDDGTRIYAQTPYGAIAEKAIVHKNSYVVLPAHIDFALAAALPNAVIGATMALLTRGKMQKENVVMINGATGVTGQLAVQVAKYYGASKIIATGRNDAALEKLKELGADVCISLKQESDIIIQQLKEIHSTTPIDLVIDYLWGHTVELILQAFKGGGVNSFTHPVKIVTVGDMAGKSINLDSGILRSSDIQILGSGLGSLSLNDFQQFNQTILPEMFQLAADGKLKIEMREKPLANVSYAWENEIAGKRTVITV